ncbi:5-oxoprolinase subunit PxpB [Pseudomonas sp. 21LCFQ02]|uniref:5-oxoprolinase subunit PxpB n=1 Tax=Pseudomonas sp. 21LCFQ02 TaxID=2957505 RepID=UPI00209A9C76|nr:5-oxoprolinase subunit PxpB [Pseudomonas sp. 21LCFQ02]MCO8170920.1 5-oxoprolinase subunit PxpB [Pseudomonas sp. 21LCFQ02]
MTLTAQVVSTPAAHLPEALARVSMIGARAYLLEAPGALELETQRRIWALAQSLEQRGDVQATIAGMTNLLVVFSAIPLQPQAVFAELQQLWREADPLHRSGRLIEVPVVYGGEHAIDLPALCEFSGLSDAEVIRRHHQGQYSVFAVASAPGFGYLGGLDPAIYMPRKKVPSLNMLKGMVTIGGMQSGIAVLDGPNGWNSIGFAHTPMFDPQAAQPALLAPGDTLRFVPERIEL